MSLLELLDSESNRWEVGQESQRVAPELSCLVHFPEMQLILSQLSLSPESKAVTFVRIGSHLYNCMVGQYGANAESYV